MAYITREDMIGALSEATLTALFNDGSQNTIDDDALDAVISRACAEVDSYLARSYRGPFPVEQTPVPTIVRNCALEFAIAFSFERNPEYVHTFGEQYRAHNRHERACEMAERLATGLQETPDWVLSPKGMNVGGIIYNSGPLTIIDGPDGSKNGGDF